MATGFFFHLSNPIIFKILLIVGSHFTSLFCISLSTMFIFWHYVSKLYNKIKQGLLYF